VADDAHPVPDLGSVPQPPEPVDEVLQRDLGRVLREIVVGEVGERERGVALCGEERGGR